MFNLNHTSGIEVSFPVNGLSRYGLGPKICRDLDFELRVDIFCSHLVGLFEA